MIAIVALAVILVGSLGYSFWQNFLSPSSQQSNSEVTVNETPKDVAEVGELNGSYSLPLEDMRLNYPSNWKFISKYKNHNGIVDNRTLLISPNNFALEISVESYGPNWPFGERPFDCSSESADNSKLCPEYATLLAEPSLNLQNNSVFIFKTTYPDTDELKDFASLTLAKEGCKGLEPAFCERPSVKTGYYLYVNGNYYEEITAKHREEVGMYSDFTVQQMTDSDFVKSQDVQTAIAILKSIKYEN